MKRGPGTKNYWLTVWAMKASAAGMSMTEIQAKMSMMKHKSIAEIMAWKKAQAPQQESKA